MEKNTYIKVRATTKAREEVVTEKKGTFYISVQEKPERGEANKRIRTILARELHCDPKRLRLVKGGTTPSKTYLLGNENYHEQ